jgi:hypothetical protein
MDSPPRQLREAGLRRRLTELAAELLKTEEESDRATFGKGAAAEWQHALRGPANGGV